MYTMEVDGSYIKPRGRRSVPLSHYHLESENSKKEHLLRRRHVQFSTPPTHTSTPITGAGSMDWRKNFSAQSPRTINHSTPEASSKSEWSIRGDSGYEGFNSSGDRFYSRLRNEQNPKKGEFFGDLLQCAQRRVTGRPSFLESESNSRWRKIQPLHVIVCIVFCIIFASIGFSVLITYKHLYSSPVATHSNGKYRSIKYGSSDSFTTEKAPLASSSVLDSLDEFEKLFYDDPSLEEASEDLDLVTEDHDLGNIKEPLIKTNEIEKADTINIVNTSKHSTDNKSELKIKQLKDELEKNLEEIRQINLEVEIQKSKTELAKLKAFPQTSSRSGIPDGSNPQPEYDNSKTVNEDLAKDKSSVNLDVKKPSKKVTGSRQIKPKRTKKKNPLIQSRSLNMTKAKVIKSEM